MNNAKTMGLFEDARIKAEQAKEFSHEQLNAAKSHIDWCVRTIERIFAPVIPYVIWFYGNIENIKNFHMPDAYHSMEKLSGMFLVNRELFLSLFVAFYFSALAKKVLRER